MNIEKIDEIISEIKASLSDPLFYSHVFTQVIKRNKETTKGRSFYCLTEEYDALSRRLDRSGLQDSCSVRNVLTTREIANLLINEKGELNLNTIPEMIQTLEDALYSLGQDRQYDTPRRQHILQTLHFLHSSKEAVQLIKNMTKPTSHQHLEEIIRSTLSLPSNEVLNDGHVRKAALSAWLCYLRQNVGSCFATAPAIIIQEEQPLQFLKDINELLNTGRIKRTFGGVEYIAPLSKSWGAGDLKKTIIVPNSNGFEKIELWLSPGLIAAFETFEAIPSNLPLKDKIQKSKSLIKNLLSEALQLNTPFSTSAEKLIRQALLEHLGITENDVKEYDLKSLNSLSVTPLMPLSSPSGNPTKNQACRTFSELLEKAYIAFKALADNALLKSWEFTLASFAETKAAFTRWNLYSSLGLKPEDHGGIGPFIYAYLQSTLEQIKRAIQELQSEYEQLYSQVKYIEGRMQRAGSEKEIEWLKIDYKTKTNEFHTIESLRDSENEKAQKIANLYDQLIDAYYELFPHYFQEVYDADMHEVSVGPYDDSPAGFRLLFKHGRANTAQWTYIYHPQEFIQSLCSFFTASERELIHKEEFSGLERELTDITTAIVTHIRTDEFLETAFHRMAVVHNTRPIKDPLLHLDKIEKKPWAYTSGGTMGTLVSCYFGLPDKPTEVSRWVENPMELLVFFVDTLKQMPHSLTKEFGTHPEFSMLMHSPTHAFLLKPGKALFKEGWQTEAFTYTSIRDNLIKPMSNAVELLLLDESQQDFLIDLLSQKVDENARYYFNKTFSRHFGVLSSTHWRNHLIDTIENERGLQIRGYPVLSRDEIDSFLYTHLPLVPFYQVKEGIREMAHIISKKLPFDMTLFLEATEHLLETKGYSPYFTAKSFQDLFKAIFCLTSWKTFLPQDLHERVTQAARALGYALPEPIIFADTNWVKDVFAFLINPGSGKLEFWRVDPLGSTGYPMSIWEQWLNGSRKDLPWGIYTRPYEYIK